MLNDYSIKPPKLLPNWMKNVGKLQDKRRSNHCAEFVKTFFSPFPMGGPHYTHVALFDGEEVIEGSVKR